MRQRLSHRSLTTNALNSRQVKTDLAAGDGSSAVLAPVLKGTRERHDPAPAWLAANEIFLFGANVWEMGVAAESEIHCPQRLNDARYLNKFIETVNSRLESDGLFRGKIETKGQRKQRILRKYPSWFAHPYYCGDFVFKRVFPKLPVTKHIYFRITRGRNRVLSKPELLGRLASCGFQVVELKKGGGHLHFTARKVGSPLFPEDPTYGPIVGLRRLGKDGKKITVYKLRTMHPYAEYIQDYVFEQQGLAKGGKFKNDPRVTSWGRFLRKFWIDELPMIWNWVRGDLQVVGVRPISRHYHDLYPDALIERRTKYKPGLMPVIYADGPHDGIPDIAAAEERYLDAYEKAPFRTNARYFFAILHAILFRGVRSQ